MSAQTAQPNGEVPSFKIVDRLDKVPIIHDSVSYAQLVVSARPRWEITLTGNPHSLSSLSHLVIPTTHYRSLLQSTQTTSTIYATAIALASKSYDLATPVLSRTKPLLESADGLAVATIDRAEATFPYPFKTPTEDLIVVKQAKGVYDARIAPWIQSAQPVLSDVINKTAEINSALGARAHDAIQTSQDLSHALLEQLKTLTAQGKVIPGHLLDTVTKTTGDVKQILLAKDTTVQDKSNALAGYVVDHVKPVVDQIYDYVLGAKKRAEEEASKLADQAKTHEPTH
ncbi:hypothetical protein BD324DRAFT_648387 [Kockovaella imperatae]|uniref:Lipid droplet-associated perilipin protein n=1 Tax=Kockovaella imperatae TaxID=4999 RepID=A0A1Y1UQB8_9TREE|nr:hypothetical protein BD324DRAFT_648387 [Kockovaella imperatae]ORX39757.1 hypothetical protein BD324DRAFT_648387 [Kockovaella imperatae]